MRAARRSFDDGVWALADPRERKRVLLRLAALIDEHTEELAQLESADVGHPISDARGVDVPGFGEEAGEPPGRHPLVDKIAFTGSVEIGRRFLVFAGERSLHALDNYTHLKTTWVGL